MKQLRIRYITPDDAKLLIEWINNTPNNLYDSDVLNYPTLKVLCAYGDRTIAYLPMQQTLFLESLAVNQEASITEKAQAFRDLVKGAEVHASSLLIKEIYFACKDENVLAIAEHHGFERLPWPIVRMKL